MKKNLLLHPHHLRQPLAARALVISLALALAFTTTYAALAASLTQISTDPYTNSTSQHLTEVEPDTFSFGSTIVAAFQVGRFTDGGASNIGWATSQNNGATWTKGMLPGITTFQGGTYDRVSDPSVAYDAAHNVWLIASLAIDESPFVDGIGVVINPSNDGGTTWASPIVVTSHSSLDKPWIVCDNNSTSPYYGHCYVEWDEVDAGELIQMSTSADGGQSWGPPRNTADFASGVGGQPVVQPNGTVVVPINDASQSAILSFRSRDGGATWKRSRRVSNVIDHNVAGGLRTSPLPSAEMDGAGQVYVVWQDCRFRQNCKSNDIVMSTSANGRKWTPVIRIPIALKSEGGDFFVPGLAVDNAMSGSNTHLALTYYYYPNSNCNAATCQLYVGVTSSMNGGASWTRGTALAGPMPLSTIANTTQGRMVGDYISTSFSSGLAFPVLAVGITPSSAAFDEAMYAPQSGLILPRSAPLLSSRGDQPVPDAKPDHPPRPALITYH